MILKKHNKSNKNNLTILTLALVIGGCYARSKRAQDGATAQLEEVVVTARKPAESLQDVPVAVDAFSETKN